MIVIHYHNADVGVMCRRETQQKLKPCGRHLFISLKFHHNGELMHKIHILSSHCVKPCDSQAFFKRGMGHFVRKIRSSQLLHSLFVTKWDTLGGNGTDYITSAWTHPGNSHSFMAAVLNRIINHSRTAKAVCDLNKIGTGKCFS